MIEVIFINFWIFKENLIFVYVCTLKLLLMIFCLTIFNLSLYDVKYKNIFNIKICIKVRVLDYFFI
jgi:hypothetical protein